MSDSETQTPIIPPASPVATIPLASLAYSKRVRADRPGLVTAIGVISIVVACMSGLTSLAMGFETFGFLMMSRVFSTMSASTGATAVTTTTTTTSGPLGGSPGAAPAPAPASNALTPAQIQQVTRSIQQKLGPTPLNPAQVATLQKELANPKQEFLSPALVWSPVQSVSQTSGEALIVLNGSGSGSSGMLQIDSAGAITSYFTNSGTGGTGFPSSNPFKTLNIPAAVTFAIENFASMALAIFLLVAGIITLASARTGRRLHIIYAAIKIPLVIVSAVAASMSVAGILSGGSAVIIYWIVGLLLIGGGTYPVALYFALRARSVRAYYTPAPASP